MNPYKFIGAFIPLVGVSIHSALQTLICGAALDTNILKIVLLVLFVFGVVVVLSTYNPITFAIIATIGLVVGVFLTTPTLTTPEMPQYVLEYIRQATRQIT